MEWCWINLCLIVLNWSSVHHGLYITESHQKFDLTRESDLHMWLIERGCGGQGGEKLLLRWPTYNGCGYLENAEVWTFFCACNDVPTTTKTEVDNIFNNFSTWICDGILYLKMYPRRKNDQIIYHTTTAVYCETFSKWGIYIFPLFSNISQKRNLSLSKRDGLQLIPTNVFPFFQPLHLWRQRKSCSLLPTVITTITYCDIQD